MFLDEVVQTMLWRPVKGRFELSIKRKKITLITLGIGLGGFPSHRR